MHITFKWTQKARKRQNKVRKLERARERDTEKKKEMASKQERETHTKCVMCEYVFENGTNLEKKNEKER